MADVFTVDAPTLNELLPKGAGYTIEWTDTLDDFPYTVELEKNNIFVAELHAAVGVKELYWEPDAGRTTGADYTIKVIDNSANEAFSAQFTLYTLHSRPLSETANASDSLDRGEDILRALSETADASDSLDRFIDWLKSITEYVLARDSMIVNYITTNYDHYVYHIDSDAWTEFSHIDELRSCTLTGGSLTENINLILTNTGVVNKYPGDDITSTDSVMVSRRFDLRKGIVKKIWVDFTGSPEVKTRVYNEDYASPYYKDDAPGTFLKRTWRWITNGYNRGDSFELHITNADIIKNAVVDVSIIGKG